MYTHKLQQSFLIRNIILNHYKRYTFNFIFNLRSLAIAEAKSYLKRNEFQYAEWMNQYNNTVGEIPQDKYVFTLSYIFRRLGKNTWNFMLLSPLVPFFYLQKKSHTQNVILKSKKSVLNLILLFNRAAEKWLKDVAIWCENPESRKEWGTINM